MAQYISSAQTNYKYLAKSGGVAVGSEGVGVDTSACLKPPSSFGSEGGEDCAPSSWEKVQMLALLLSLVQGDVKRKEEQDRKEFLAQLQFFSGICCAFWHCFFLSGIQRKRNVGANIEGEGEGYSLARQRVAEVDALDGQSEVPSS